MYVNFDKLYFFLYFFICKLFGVCLFLSSKIFGCFTHIMNVDPTFFWLKTYSKFMLLENI
jgi:hypothetical protein